MSINIMAVMGTALLSHLISYSTGEPVSHIAIGYDLDAHGHGIVFHVDLAGARVEWNKDFKKTHIIVKELQIPIQDEHQKVEFLEFINKNDGTAYDVLKLTSSGFYTLAHRFFGTPIPVRTDIASKTALLCNELLNLMPEWIFKNPPDMSMILTPMQSFDAIAVQHPDLQVISYE